ncbi:translocon-associated protein subunit alpha [Entomortierella parvispora]|uniref:Translocon-associated protein subunit alpha n=1 Tax=Entomortierella parvispora TaxID=205924 RepID=A0A9P3H9D9_9FUNG|nr:translocon-associated protein subunit alpha [Entomortierella parvispora]
MFGLKQSLKALLCGAIFLASVSAQTLPNVAVNADFPNAIAGLTPDLISGEANDLKVTFRNTGKTDLKVNLIVGSVVEMTDFSNVIRNLTAYRYGTTLKADGTLILPYTIKMEHASREVGLTLMADIMDSSKNHFPVLIYNSTINFTEPIQGWIDIQLIFLYVVIAGLFIAIGMFIKDAMAPEVKKSVKKTPSMTPEEREAALEKMKVLDEDWIPEHHKKSPRVTKRRS